MNPEAISAFDALTAAVDTVAALDTGVMDTRGRLEVLEHCERLRRRVPALEHAPINPLARQATPEELGGGLSHAIAEWTLISRPEASRRVKEAADLGPQSGLTGQPLTPVLEATAAGPRSWHL